MSHSLNKFLSYPLVDSAMSPNEMRAQKIQAKHHFGYLVHIWTKFGYPPNLEIQQTTLPCF